MSLSKKLESDRTNADMVSECEQEIRKLHHIFVTWFRGEKPLPDLKADLRERMLPNFSHVAPNGHMVKGRDVLIHYLSDKYQCYQDRVFRIDVYNVQLLWSSGNKFLASYEEWQSWDSSDESDEEKQQFGRLSTCLLERKNNKLRWVHVHETWMEAEEPFVAVEEPQANREEDSVMTGPAPPKASAFSTANKGPSTPVSANNPALLPRNDDDDDSDSEANVLLAPAKAAAPYDFSESSNHSDSKDASASTDETNLSELQDKVGDLKVIPDKNKMTPEERQFLENSQGILVFEDDETNANSYTPTSPMKSGGNKLDLDALMEDNHSDSQVSGDDPLLNSSQAMLSLHSAADASHKRHVSSRLEQYAQPLKWEGSLVGVSISGFDIGTSQGPIADSAWYKEHGRKLEKMAQPVSGGGKRKLCLPEMIFAVAHVAIEGHGIWMSWDATDCMEQWARQHAQIPIQSDKQVNGVSVLKTKDAALWAGRSKKNHHHKSSKDAVFHYDWSFSTPFANKVEGGAWLELDESGMRMELLTDKNVPILFFDEIVLYEDDLHDNGQVQYSVKLRVMPTCSYILARLWVRVDSVLVRCRETRVLVDFFGLKPKIFRDVTWRECEWSNLEAYGLPSSLRDWSCETGSETSEWNKLLQSLPEVELPEGMIRHAILEYGIDASGANNDE